MKQWSEVGARLHGASSEALAWKLVFILPGARPGWWWGAGKERREPSEQTLVVGNIV